MTDRKKRAGVLCLAVFLAAAALAGLYFLIAPHKRAPRPVTAPEAKALQRVIDGVLKNDPKTYRGAFLPGYDAALEKETAVWKYENGPAGGFADLDAYLKDLFAKTHAACIENYGKNFAAEFVTGEIKEINTADYPSYFENFHDYYVYDYAVDMAAVEKAAAVAGFFNIWGDQSEKSAPAEYIFIKTKDGWALHPAYFFMTFG